MPRKPLVSITLDEVANQIRVHDDDKKIDALLNRLGYDKPSRHYDMSYTRKEKLAKRASAKKIIFAHLKTLEQQGRVKLRNEREGWGSKRAVWLFSHWSEEKQAKSVENARLRSLTQDLADKLGSGVQVYGSGSLHLSGDAVQRLMPWLILVSEAVKARNNL